MPSPGPPPKFRKRSDSPLVNERFRYSQSPPQKNGGRNGHRSPERRRSESRPVSHCANGEIKSVAVFNSNFKSGTVSCTWGVWTARAHVGGRDKRHFRAFRYSGKDSHGLRCQDARLSRLLLHLLYKNTGRNCRPERNKRIQGERTSHPRRLQQDKTSAHAHTGFLLRKSKTTQSLIRSSAPATS